jgi:hypothetical protein
MWETDMLRAFVIQSLTNTFTSTPATAALQVRAGIDYGVDNWKLVGVRKLATQAHMPSPGDIALLGPVCTALVLKHRAALIAHTHKTHLDEVRRMRRCKCDDDDEDYSICVSCQSFNALRDSPLVPTPWVSSAFMAFLDGDVRKTMNIQPPTKAAAATM